MISHMRHHDAHTRGSGRLRTPLRVLAVSLLLLSLSWTVSTVHAATTHATGGSGQRMQVRLPLQLSVPVTGTLATTTSASVAGTNTFIVTTTADVTKCPDANGNISLRCAIQGANVSPANYAKVITFAIPSGDPGCHATTISGQSISVCTIQPTGLGLPGIVTPNVTINGYSQPGSKQNTLSSGDNAILTIQLDGTQSATPSVGGLSLEGGNETVEGLSITHFPADAVGFIGSGDSFQGNFVGITPAGASSGNQSGLFIRATGSLAIGGTAPGARNVISGNTQYGIYLYVDSHSLIRGNDIGTTPDGTTALPNGVGISTFMSQNDTIGGTTTGAGNLVSGNSGNGIELADGHGNLVQGNTVGLSVARASLPNAGNGIALYGDSMGGETGDTIGGTATGGGNTVAFNGGNGVLVGRSGSDGATVGDAVEHNSIFANGVLGISLNSLPPISCSNAVEQVGVPNNDLPCPVIITASASTGIVTGTAWPSSMVEVYRALPTTTSLYPTNGEGITFLGSVRADTTGHWSLMLPAGTLTSGLLTATATSSGVAATPETSDFSTDVAIS